MLLYPSCCSALFGQLKFRLANSPPCHSISSSLHHFEIASSTSVGTLLSVGNPSTMMIDSCKRVAQDLATSTPENFYCLRIMKLYRIYIHEAPLLIIVKYCMSFIPI